MDDLQSYVADLDAGSEQFSRLAGDDPEWAANCVVNLIKHIAKGLDDGSRRLFLDDVAAIIRAAYDQG